MAQWLLFFLVIFFQYDFFLLVQRCFPARMVVEYIPVLLRSRVHIQAEAVLIVQWAFYPEFILGFSNPKSRIPNISPPTNFFFVINRFWHNNKQKENCKPSPQTFNNEVRMYTIKRKKRRFLLAPLVEWCVRYSRLAL